MKNLRLFAALFFYVAFLVSCEKPESEENKPDDPAQLVTTEPRIDLIKKVIRYNASGAIEDSVLFQYDTQNRISKIEYGPFVNGQFKNKIEYKDSLNQNTKCIVERNFELDNSGKYQQKFFIVYRNNPENRISTAYRYMNNYNYPEKRYNFQYDSLGLVKSVNQQLEKQADWFMDVSFKYLNGDLTEAIIGGDPFGYTKTNYEYYPQPYNYAIYTGIYVEGLKFSWNAGLANQSDFRNCFLGIRNKHLLKKQVLLTSDGKLVEEVNYQYEFNNKGLISKILTTPVSASGISLTNFTTFELFYY